MKKSTLYVNGRIYTMDPDNTVYEAMAVEDGRIVRLGTTKELMEEMAPDQELEDLKGCPVLPGMCDCHVHMDMTGAIMVAIDAAGKGKEELLEENFDVRRRPVNMALNVLMGIPVVLTAESNLTSYLIGKKLAPGVLKYIPCDFAALPRRNLFQRFSVHKNLTA